MALVSGACSSDGSDGDSQGAATNSEPADGNPEKLPGDDLRMNDIQMLGSHNSYHLAAVPEVAKGLESLAPSLWETIDYSHKPLPEQLEKYRIRQLELDVYPDPEGGLYSTPAALELLTGDKTEVPGLSEPGFKVAHIEDVDYNTTCLTFVECLTQVQSWSAANPTHLPVMIMVETKGDDLRSGDGDLGIDVDTLGVEFARPPDMTPTLYEDLETEILSVFDKSDIITPDDVRGDADTLPEAITTTGWPTIAESRGKVLFALVDTGEQREIYTSDSPNLSGKLLFTSSEPGRPDAAFIRVDDSIENGAELRSDAEGGYLIRTRTDEPGIHAKNNDTSLRDSALASGAQYLSTDYYAPDPVTGFVVQLPGGVVARCNPVTAPPDCDTVSEG